MSKGQRTAFLIIFFVEFCTTQGCTRVTKTATPTATLQGLELTPTEMLTLTPTITLTPVTPTLIQTRTPITTATSTSTTTPTPVPPGVFALLFYPPLVMNYDTSVWKDESHYTDPNFMVNYLQARSLKMCRITIQGPSGLYPNPPDEFVYLGNVKYQVTTLKDSPSGLMTTIYIEDQSLSGYDYVLKGLPVPVVQASPTEWKECKNLAEKVLSTLHSPN